MEITKKIDQEFFGLFESIPDAIVVIDSDGKIAFVNRESEKLFGYSRDELLEKPLEILPPDCFPEKEKIDRRLSLTARHKTGSVFPVEISLSQLQIEKGIFTTISIRNITDYKKVEEELEKAREELEMRVEERTMELMQANFFLEEQIEERRRAEERIRQQAALIDVVPV